MNIIENKMDVINNLNHSLAAGGPSSGQQSISVPATPQIGTIKRNRLPKLGHSDKISFGGCDNTRKIDQPLYVKSKEDGSWTSVHNASYHYQQNLINSSDNNQYKLSVSGNGGNLSNGCGAAGAAGAGGSQVYLSSFGKSDNV